MKKIRNKITAAASGKTDRQKTSETALFKIGTMLVLSVVMLVFGAVAWLTFSSTAWFSQNDNVDANGMQVAALDKEYEILALESSINGKYTVLHSQVKDSEAIVWKMTADNNMGNSTSTDNGIGPGSKGCISFYVKPKVDSVTLNYSFELIGYSYDDNETNPTLTELDSRNDSDIINYLNGHILLFENYDTDTQKYSGLIKTGDDLKRVISTNKTYNGKGTSTQVDIYWVWPENLSDLIAVDPDPEQVGENNEGNDENVKHAFCSDNDFLSYIEAHPQYFMRGVNSFTITYDLYDTESDNYQLYGGRYDLVDNLLGARVQYLRLKMTVSVSS